MTFEHTPDAAHAFPSAETWSPRTTPGKATLTSRITPVARKAAGDETVSSAAEPLVARAASGVGHPLPGSLRDQWAQSLGVDLDAIRIHTGDRSGQAASALRAKAYTVGNDIHFASGQYDPSSRSGQTLLAHEVAHTVQQRGGPARRQHKLQVSQPDDALEAEADTIAERLVSGESARGMVSGSRAARSIHRWSDDNPRAVADRQFVQERIGRARDARTLRAILTGLRRARQGRRAPDGLLRVRQPPSDVFFIHPDDLGPLIEQARARLRNLRDPTGAAAGGQASVHNAPVPRGEPAAAQSNREAAPSAQAYEPRPVPPVQREASRSPGSGGGRSRGTPNRLGGANEFLLPGFPIPLTLGTLEVQPRVQLRHRQAEPRPTPRGRGHDHPQAAPTVEGLNRRGSNRNTITTTGQLTHRISRRINHDLLRVRDRVSLAWEPFGGARGAVGIQFPAFGLWDGSRMTIRIDLASYDRRNGFRGPSLTASRAWDTRLMYGMAVRLRVDVTFRPNWVRLLRRAGIQTAATETAIAAAPVVAGLLWMGFLARTLINASEEGRRQGMATWYAPAYAHSLASRVFDAPSDDALASRDVADYRGVLRTRRAARRDARLRFRSLSRAQVMALRQQHGSVERFRLAVETELCRRMHIPAPRR